MQTRRITDEQIEHGRAELRRLIERIQRERPPTITPHRQHLAGDDVRGELAQQCVAYDVAWFGGGR